MANLTISSIIISVIAIVPFSVRASEIADTIGSSTRLQEITVTNNSGIRKLTTTGMNTEIITSAELKKAACCNLGESFTTNPSVDVSYSDAATGARQIKLLGLGGQYVQMLTENIPNFRGAAAPYGLGYLAGPWMSSIQVSKGASSVKNGFESVTGQINIEMLKPQAEESLAVNAYVNQMGKGEVNATGNLHFGDRWKGGLLLHGENAFASHDDNGDSFLDSPKVRQFAGLNRWIYMGDRYVFQAGLKFLDERREGGQRGHHANHIQNPYLIDIETDRWELFTKNAYIFDKENDGNVALILSGSLHDQDNRYGLRYYNVDQQNLYASLMFERKWKGNHALSTGISFNGDWYRQHLNLQSTSVAPSSYPENETTPGVYAQYTYSRGKELVAMAGIRYDYSSIYGSMITPRIHVRWNPSNHISAHGSIGKGYRTPHPFADNAWIMPSSRQIVIEENLKQEKVWNMGAGLSGKFNIASARFNWNVEYYYTDFRNQTAVDLDMNPHQAHIRSISDSSYSHSWLAEFGCAVSNLTINLAAKYDDVKLDFGRGLEEKPLHSKWKGLVTVSYAPMMGKWQFDSSLSINGGGRMPTPYVNSDGTDSWQSRYKAFPQLNLQVTRNFRHWGVYIGGENLTGYKQKMPVIGAENPWGTNFDASMVYGPLEGRVLYAGFRYNITK